MDMIYIFSFYATHSASNINTSQVFGEMTKTLILLHILNILIGCLCIAILGLTVHTIIVKDRIETSIPKHVKSTEIPMLMWAGCGGIVDMLLFLGLLVARPFPKNAVRH